VRLTQKQAQIYKIELEDGSFIRATYEHPVLTQNGWKIVGELTDDDEIVKIDI
jgi:intein/homing endonuclease